MINIVSRIKHRQTNKHRPVSLILLVIGLIGVIVISGFLYFTDSPSGETGVNGETAQVVPIASDSFEAEFSVLAILNKDNAEYATLSIDKIIFYSRDKNAYYDEIKPGDEIEVYLPFGSGERDTGLTDATYGSRLNGLNGGDKLRGAVSGCPGKCNGGRGWALFLYKSV